MADRIFRDPEEQPRSAEHEWMTLKEAAAYLRMDERHVKRLIDEGRLAAGRINGTGTWRLRRKDVVGVIKADSRKVTAYLSGNMS